MNPLELWLVQSLAGGGVHGLHLFLHLFESSYCVAKPKALAIVAVSANRSEKFTKSGRADRDAAHESFHSATRVDAATSDLESTEKTRLAPAWLMFCFYTCHRHVLAPLSKPATLG